METSLRRFIADRAIVDTASERARMLEIAARYKDVISFGRGDPDLATPANVIEAGRVALASGATHYSHWAGVPKLREAIAGYLQKFDGIGYDPLKEIIVTNGAQEAIVVTMLTLLNPGDEVLVPEPRYTPYDFSIALAGGKLVTVPTFAEDNWAVTVRELKKAITPRTKVLLLINPNNPTGTVMLEDNLVEIAKFAREHDLVVISDELYSGLLYENVPWKSIAALPNMRERTIVINGFSKTYSMTGWRLGYLAGPEALVKPMLEIHYSLTICAPAVSQAAGIEALNGSQESVTTTIKTYDERRRLTIQRLTDMKIPFVKPLGAFYVFPDVSKYEMKSFDFCVRLLDQSNVLLFPGTVFGTSGEGFVRLSLLRPIEELAEGFDRMEKVLKSW